MMLISDLYLVSIERVSYLSFTKAAVSYLKMIPQRYLILCRPSKQEDARLVSCMSFQVQQMRKVLYKKGWVELVTSMQNSYRKGQYPPTMRPMMDPMSSPGRNPMKQRVLNQFLSQWFMLIYNNCQLLARQQKNNLLSQIPIYFVCFREYVDFLLVSVCTGINNILMSQGQGERESDIAYNQRYKKFQEKKNEVIKKGRVITKEITNDVQQTGRMIEEDNRILDRINKRADEVNKAAERNNTRMERYLQRTSNCQLYVVIACQLLIFLILMSI